MVEYEETTEAEKEVEKEKKPKGRKITEKDFVTLQEFVKKELDRRRESPFRKRHEIRMREVDRQVNMEPMVRKNNDGTIIDKDKDWHSVVEPGELSKASEVIGADVRRLTFPNPRNWFDAHVELKREMGEDGKPQPVNQDVQEQADGMLRALMVQQHMDFGFKDRFDLSVKEALHHSTFVATVECEYLTKVHHGESVGIEHIAAPVWVPHSLWNCFLDPNPSVVAANMFYTGSMIIVSYQSRKALKDALETPGYIKKQYKKIPEETRTTLEGRETEDLEIITYYGDVYIHREKDEIYLPNSKVMLANDVFIYYNTNDTPVPPVLVGQYERLDVRDPYAVSPIIKESANQKIAAVLINKFLDGVALHVEPPIVYDGNDQDLVGTGGPIIAPGAKSASKNLANFKVIETGDPGPALEAYQVLIQEIQQGTGVNAARAGAMDSVERTATESRIIKEGGNIRTVDFVDKLEQQALRAFLYLQHELNKKKLENYPFYNPETNSPDFLRASKGDLPKNAHFEIVGSKGLLDDEQRVQRTNEVVQNAQRDERTAGLLDMAYVLKKQLEDAGQKSPEMWLMSKDGNESPEVMALKQDFELQMQEHQQIIEELQGKLQEAESKNQAKLKEIENNLNLKTQELDLKEAYQTKELELKERMAQEKAELERWIAQEKADLEEKKAMLEGIRKIQEAGQKQEADAANAGKESKESAEKESKENANKEIMTHIASLIETLNKPKRLILDKKGMPTGIEAVQ